MAILIILFIIGSTLFFGSILMWTFALISAIIETIECILYYFNNGRNRKKC